MEHKPESILAAAVAVFGDYGVNVSTAKVAKAAGVSNGTLFNYFPTKQDLIDRLYVSLKQNLADAIGDIDNQQSLADQFRDVWQRWSGWAQANEAAHEVMNLLHQSGMASPEAQLKGANAFATVAELMNTATDAGTFVDLPMNYLNAVIQSHLDHAITTELDEQQLGLAYNVLWSAITNKNQRSEHP